MKVTLEKNFKSFYTIEDLEIAKSVIKSMKEDTSTVKDYFKMAVAEYLRKKEGYCKEVISAEATTAQNRRAWNAYGGDIESQHMDIWISGLAKVGYNDGYIELGAYLTDIWQIDGETDVAENFLATMFVKERKTFSYR